MWIYSSKLYFENSFSSEVRTECFDACKPSARFARDVFHTRHGEVRVRAGAVPVDGTKHMLHFRKSFPFRSHSYRKYTLRSYEHLCTSILRKAWALGKITVIRAHAPTTFTLVKGFFIAVVITAPLCLSCDVEVSLLEPALLELSALNFFGSAGCTQHLPGFSSQKLNLK